MVKEGLQGAAVPKRSDFAVGWASVVAQVRRALLRWYVREIRGIKIAQDPNERTVTYPLA